MGAFVPGPRTSPRTRRISPCAAGVPSAACEPAGSSPPSSVRSPGPPTRASDPSLQCAGRPSPSHRWGRRHAGARPRPPGPRYPRGARGQPRARAARRRLGRPLSRTGAHHPASNAPRDRLRAFESPEALRGRTRPGSLLVGTVVRRVAGGRRDRARGGAGGPGAHLACRRRLAPPRSRPHRRPAATSRPDETLATATAGVLAEHALFSTSPPPSTRW